MAGEADDADVVAEVLAAELRADADLLGELEDLLLQLQVAEAVAGGGALGGELVQVVGGRRTWPSSARTRRDVPPTTIARWYGGQAAVPSERIFSSRNCIIESSLRTALVSW